MRAQPPDLRHTLDLAAGLVTDADQHLHAAQVKPLPQPHKRLIASARRNLDAAQQDLFKARNDPYGLREPRPRQLELA